MKGMEELNHEEAEQAVKSLVYDTFAGGEKMSLIAEKKHKAERAKELLLRAFHPGDTVYCICTHWTESGQRSIVVLLTRPNYKGIWNMSAYVSHLLGWRYDQIHDGVVCENGSADLVYNLAYQLFGDGQQLSRRDV
jgi:hypothetical protein